MLKYCDRALDTLLLNVQTKLPHEMTAFDAAAATAAGPRMGAKRQWAKSSR